MNGTISNISDTVESQCTQANASQLYYFIAIGPNTYTLNKGNENLVFGRFLYELGQRFLLHYTTEATAPQQNKSEVILDVLKDSQHETKPTHILLCLHWLQPKINIHRNN